MKNLFCNFLILIITQVCGLLNQPINAQSGTLDPSFGIAGKVTTSFKNEDRGRVAIIQRDGKIVVAGYCINGSKRDVAIIRYMPDGSLDNSFDFDGTLIKSSSAVDDSWAIALQDDGKIIVVWTIFVMIGNANGDYYIEACHIKAKAEGGKDRHDNILILCPNCHKLFDFGNREKEECSKDSYSVIINGKKYKVSLK